MNGRLTITRRTHKPCASENHENRTRSTDPTGRRRRHDGAPDPTPEVSLPSSQPIRSRRNGIEAKISADGQRNTKGRNGRDSLAFGCGFSRSETPPPDRRRSESESLHERVPLSLSPSLEQSRSKQAEEGEEGDGGGEREGTREG